MPYKDPAKQAAYMRAWKLAHPQYQTQQRTAHPGVAAAYARNARARNPEAGREAVGKYRAAHPDRMAAHYAKMRADEIRRTPAWADLQKIAQIYAEARGMTRMLGEPWHVDHEIPLRGRLVSGLHTHTNLQLLPGAENISKGNRYEV